MKTASNTKKSSAGAGRAPKDSSESASAGKTELMKYFHDGLKDIYNAEKQLVKALPKMAKAATSEELVAAFKDHLAVTQNQVTRLEQVFEAAGLKVASKKCEAMEGLVKEGEEAIEETEDGSLVRDVALIVAAQKVEHYEMAGYGSLRSIATILGLDKAATLLQETLDEEGEADHALTDIASEINVEAYEEDSEEGSEESSPRGQSASSANAAKNTAARKK